MLRSKHYKKVAFLSLAIFWITMLLVYGLVGVAYGHSSFAFVSPLATVIPTIDGVESAGEWPEMSYLNLTNIVNTPQNGTSAMNPAYLKVKYDGTNLYILLDWHNDGQVHASGCVYIGFDTNHDGAATPQPDDYMFHCCPWDYQGNGTAWVGVPDTVLGATHWRSGASWPGDLAGACQHPSTSRLEEIAFPLANIGVSPGDTIGFYVFMAAESDPWFWANAYVLPMTPSIPTDPNTGIWPMPPSPPPNQWADLTFAAPAVGGVVTPVDKLALLAPYIALAIAIIAAIISIVYIRKR